MINVVRKYGILLLIPGIVLGFALLLKMTMGPYWLATNYDPSYLEFVNGLRILKGVPVNDATHPGTPVQIVCCAVCWLFNIGSSRGETVLHVLKSPEFYLYIDFLVFTLFSFLTSIALAVYVFRRTGDKLAAVLTQLPALTFLVMKSRETLETAVIPIASNVSPEAMLIGILNLFSICLFVCFFSKISKDEFFLALIWGGVCGLGTAVKLTFFPLLVIPLIILSWRNKFIFMGVFMASFFVWTLPALSRYPAEWKLITDFFTHNGSFAETDQSGPAAIHSYCLNWMKIIVEHWVFAGFLVTALLLSFWEFMQKKREKASFFIPVISLSVLLQFSIVAKSPGEHYLLPGLGLFSPILVLFYLLGPGCSILGRRISFVFILVFTLAGVWRVTEYRSKLESFTNDNLSFINHIHDKYKEYTFIGYYRTSGQDSALNFGDVWNGQPQFRDELFRLYPNSYFLSCEGWGDRIVTFKDRVLSNDLLARSKGVIFMGDYTYGDLVPALVYSPFTVVPLERGRFEGAYLLTATTEKEALMSFLAAIHFFQEGDYAKSLAFAVQAKALHYQEVKDIDAFIRFVTPYVQH